MAPVFSLVWDEDVSVRTALTFPELYKDLMKVRKHPLVYFIMISPQGKSLSYISFLLWVMISVYQGMGNNTQQHTCVCIAGQPLFDVTQTFLPTTI